jgi:hypothetical protein
MQRTGKALEAAKLLSFEAEVEAEYLNLERVRGQMDHVLRAYQGVFSDEPAPPPQAQTEDDVQMVITRALERVRGALLDGDQPTAAPVSAAGRATNRASPPGRWPQHSVGINGASFNNAPVADDHPTTQMLFSPGMNASPPRHHFLGPAHGQGQGHGGFGLAQQQQQQQQQQMMMMQFQQQQQQQQYQPPQPHPRLMTVRAKGVPASGPARGLRPQAQGQRQGQGQQGQGQQARFPKYDAQRGLFDVNPASVRSYQLETYATRRKQRELEQPQQQAELLQRRADAVRLEQQQQSQPDSDANAWGSFHSAKRTGPRRQPA